MLEDVKALLGIEGTDKDRILQLLITQAIDEAKDFTHREDIYPLQSTIEKMVIFNYNKMGVEGLDSESYSGQSYHYYADYPESIMRTLKRYRKLIVL